MALFHADFSSVGAAMEVMVCVAWVLLCCTDKVAGLIGVVGSQSGWLPGPALRGGGIC